MIYFIVIGDVLDFVISIIQELRRQGIECQMDLTFKLKMGGQKKEARRLGAKYLVYVGDEEKKNGKIKFVRSKF